MRKADAKTPTGDKKNAQPLWDGKIIALQMMDTTWRVALPIILLTYGGVSLDKHLNTSPLYSLIGLFVSLAMATLLVYRQLAAAYPGFWKNGSKK